ncbi:MAG: DUF2490 domain-containing protein [Fluviicola sp.]|jgi:hypothetical protein
MRRLVALVAVFIGFSSFAQDRGEFWFAAGLKREVAKNIVAGANTNLRVSYTGQLRTLYQEISVKSEHLDWFRPSIEYRLITSYDERGNYMNSNRLNINLDFRHKIEDLKLGTRLRYQMNLGSASGGGGDLDPSYRFKPYFSYEPKGWKVTPEISAEWFYTTTNSPVGNRFNRFRGGISANINLPGSNELGVTYYYGRKYNTGNPYSEHLLSLEYTFDWKK